MRLVAWTRCVTFFAVSLLTVPGSSVFAQDVRSLADVIGGTGLKLAIKPGELPDTYKPVRFKAAGASGGGGIMDMFSAMMSPVAMILGGDQDTQGATLLGVADLSWTQGDIVRIQGKDFIVTYKWNLDLNSMAMQSKSEDPEKAKSEALKNIELTLTLQSVDSLATIMPVSNFTKADLIRIIETPIKKKEDPGLATPALPEAGEASEPAEVFSAGNPQLDNLKSLGTGMMMYVADYDDVFPYAQSTKGAQHASMPYYQSEECWRSLNPNGGQILYNVAIGGVSASSLQNPSTVVLFYETKNWPDGKRGVVFADGHVSLLTDDEWKKVEPSLKIKLTKIGKPLPLNYGLGG